MVKKVLLQRRLHHVAAVRRVEPEGAVGQHERACLPAVRVPHLHHVTAARVEPSPGTPSEAEPRRSPTSFGYQEGSEIMAVLLEALEALTFTPELCDTPLLPHSRVPDGLRRGRLRRVRV